MNLRVRRVTGVSAILVVSGDAGMGMSGCRLSIFVRCALGYAVALVRLG